LPTDAIERGVVPVIMTFSKFAASAGAAISSHVAELKPLLNVSPTSIEQFLCSTNCCCLESIRQVRKFQKSPNASGKYCYLRSRLAKHDFVALVKPMLYR